jgi:photosystem II stability/assembly factor-like uncharacterized protein
MNASKARARRNRSDRTNILASPLAIAAAAAAIVLVFAAAWMLWPGDDAEASYTPVESLEYEYSPNHLHGIGYDPENERLYLASHFGLFAREGDQFYQVGDDRSDLMGFSMNPHDPAEIFVSGHPQGGGNLGVMHSTDEGLTFDQIFTGVADEVVDFHSMTISAADPDRFYGSFAGMVYRSEDRGHTFIAINPEGLPPTGLCWGVPCLAAGSDDPDRVYAGVPDGLKASVDGGETWTVVNDELGQVAAVKVDPDNPDRIIAFTETMGLAVSNDAGLTWESLHGDLDVGPGGFVFAIALNQRDPSHMFVATMQNEVLETVDGGQTWTRVA